MMVLPEGDNESLSEAEIDSLSSTTEESGRVPDAPAEDADKEVRNKMINKEEGNVRKARFVVIAAGIAFAVAVGTAINIFAGQSEQTTFEIEVRKSGWRRSRPCFLLASRKHTTNPIRFRAHHSVQWLRY
jgi:hypothetical protein